MRIATIGGNQIGIIENDKIQDITNWAYEQSNMRIGEDPMIAVIHALNQGSQPEGDWLPVEGMKFGPPLRQPSKIIAAAANYRNHAEEMRFVNNGGDGTNIYDMGFFLKAPSSIIGPNDTVRLPFVDRRTDHEAEIAVVIGKTARNIKPEEVFDYVFGYMCLLDITVRGKEDRGFRKSFDTFTPIGPYVITKDEVENPDNLQIVCRVNAEIRQNESTSSMILSIPQLISWISSVMTLYPGDIIATGTPSGVGPLQQGDRLQISIEQLGSFEVKVDI